MRSFKLSSLLAIFLVIFTTMLFNLKDFIYVIRESRIPWSTSPPIVQGMDPVKLQLLEKKLEEKGTNAFLVVKNGKIVSEWYNWKKGWGPSRKHYTASLAKSVTAGMALLLAIQNDIIQFDDAAWKYIPSWKDDAKKSQITIAHLAMHSSGIENSRGEIEEPEESLPDWKRAYWKNVEKRFGIAIHDAPVKFLPGTKFEYSNTGVSALAYALAVSLQTDLQSDVYSFLRKKLMEPLEIPESEWSISYNNSYDVDGLKLYELGGGGGYTARAVARVGQLLVQKGEWKGQQLISSELINTLINNDNSPFPDDKEHPRASFGWWSNIDGVFEKLPPDAIIGAGRGHQIILVIPSLELVAVRFGDSLSQVSGYSLSGDYWEVLEQYLFNPLMETMASPKSTLNHE